MRLMLLIVTLCVVAGLITALRASKPQSTAASGAIQPSEWPLRFVSARRFRCIVVECGAGSYRLENRGRGKGEHGPESRSIQTEDSLDEVLSEAEAARWVFSDSGFKQLGTAQLNYLIAALHSLRLDQRAAMERGSGDLTGDGASGSRATLRVEFDDTQVTIRFGDYNSYLKRRFVQIDECPDVYLVQSGLFEAMTRAAAARSDAMSLQP